MSRAAIARLLDISRAAVSKWGEIVPEGTAYKLESLTGGELKVDRKLYEPRSTVSASERVA